MPYYYQGLCYGTPQLALQAHLATYPLGSTDFVVYIPTSPASTVTNAGLMSFPLIRLNVNNNNGTSSNKQVQLTSCLVPDIPMNYSVAGSFWAFGFASVLTMFFIAHAIGLVLKSVRGF